MNPTPVSPSSDFERRLADWLDDQAPMHEPSGLTYAVLARTRRTRRMPRWVSPERWLSMAVITRPALAPPLRAAWLALIALLVLALAAGGAIVGSRLLLPAGAVIPQGGAAVLAFDANGDIFTVRADGTDMRQVTSGPDIESDPTWSPDGTRIAYRLRQSGTDSVAIMDAGGGHRATLATTDQASKDCLPNEPPAWSPDGQSLVFSTSAACDGPRDLFIVASDASSPATSLLAPGLNGSQAAWSPDGTQIVFRGQDATGGTGVYVVDVEVGRALTGGFAARRISDAGTYADGSWQAPQWSPDGTEVAVAAGTNIDCTTPTVGTTDAFALKADGSGQRLLTAETAKEYLPTWSPDGRQVAFLRLVEPSEWVNGRPCTLAPWVVDGDGTNQRRLDGIGPDPDVQPPLWSPDGTRIVGDLNTEGASSVGLYVVTVDGSSPLMTIPDIHKGYASWQPVAAPLPPAPSFAAVSPTP